jgi:hypothetical protein
MGGGRNRGVGEFQPRITRILANGEEASTLLKGLVEHLADFAVQRIARVAKRAARESRQRQDRVHLLQHRQGSQIGTDRQNTVPGQRGAPVGQFRR